MVCGGLRVTSLWSPSEALKQSIGSLIDPHLMPA